MLLDECVPRPLKKEFVGHDVKTAREAGLAGLKNGQLLRAAEGEFDALGVPFERRRARHSHEILLLLREQPEPLDEREEERDAGDSHARRVVVVGPARGRRLSAANVDTGHG